MRHVGSSPPRPDGPEKAKGSAVYTDDEHRKGMFFGATVRSPLAHARILGIDWHPDKAPPGSVCVTAADLAGPNAVKLVDETWPIIANGRVRHVGEAVALVAAPSRPEARLAREAVEVRYEELPPVLTISAAENHPPLATQDLDDGNVDEALAAAEFVVEGSYSTGHQEHLYIECQAVTAEYLEDGTLDVVGSMQCPFYVQKSLEHALRLREDRIRVKAAAVGGGFGGKEDYPSMLALHAALLARASGRPVRLAYDRHEDIIATTKRHPAVIRHRTGLDRQGRLQAMDIEIVMDGGAYATLSLVVLSRAVLHACGPYRCPNVRVRGRVLATHTATNGAFRGFGAPQVLFAAERHMDRISRTLGIDPLEIRLRNVLVAGDTLPTGQVLDETTSARECLETVAKKTNFRDRWQANESARTVASPQPRKGLGLSLYLHGGGFTGNGERRMRSPVAVRLTEEGHLEALTSMVDMGQGCNTIFPQIACEASGLRPDQVVFAPPDTSKVPDSGPTVASRTTMVVGATLALAVQDLCETLLTWWRKRRELTQQPQIQGGKVVADEMQWPFGDVARKYRREVGELHITRRHEPPTWQAFDEDSYRGEAYAAYSWGADVAEVEVDQDVLEVRPVRLDVVCEVGRVLHPRLCAGQVEGGTLQSVGWGLLEEMKMEEGRYLNDRLATYIIPTIKDSPEIEVEFLDRPSEIGPFGAKGVGELPMDGGAPAVAAAIENATGIVVSDIPATPERLLNWRVSGQTVECLDGAAGSDEGGGHDAA